ncbi:Transcriptional regulator of nonfermentable carbon utilization [Mucor velutinosus]|uniref:Transcriptional regulator of nonfermentable carbon utilization n=1 Tax=Mucor velutinosus TaxID=708070 RepID=A0AAN7DLH9_9FUNG|nr:Transcriptional regulator of nonfermentable carbon utilization [Mucor velutinosus]
MDTFSVALQPQFLSPVPDTDQTTYKTRYWELPDERRHDLALLSQFIKEQIDKKDKVKQNFDSSFGSTLKSINDKTTMLNRDVMTLSEKLEATDKSIDHLISQTMGHRLEVNSASDVLQSRNMLGGSENGKLFENTTINMEKRINQLSETVSTLEQTVNSLETNASFSPQLIGAVLNRQSRAFVSLAGCVAHTHQEIVHLLEYHRSSS